MKNILFVSQHFNVAGTETFMMNVLRFIDRAHYHIDFLIFSPDYSAYSEEAESLGATIYRLPGRRHGFIYYRELKSFFKKKSKEYDVVHWCGGAISSLAPLYFAYKYKIPVRAVHAHNSKCEGLHNKILHSINRRISMLIFNRFLACSKDAGCFFFGKRPFHIIRNGINVDSYVYSEKKKSELLESIGIIQNEGTFVMGNIGRLEFVKNQRFILQVFSEVLKKIPKAELLLVGSGTMQDKLVEMASSLGIEEKVHFLGQRSDVCRVLSAIDLFLMPSLYEGLPFVLVEAQSAGCQCLVSDVIATDVELTKHVKFLSLQEPVKSWTDSVIRMYENNHYNRANDALIVKRKGFDVQNMVHSITKIYNGK